MALKRLIGGCLIEVRLYVDERQGAKKVSFTACHLGKL